MNQGEHLGMMIMVMDGGISSGSHPWYTMRSQFPVGLCSVGGYPIHGAKVSTLHITITNLFNILQ